MKALTKAIFSKLSGSSLSTAIGGRLYEGLAPNGATMPYCSYYIVNVSRDWTFGAGEQDVLVQFSLFDNNSSADTIKDAYDLLKALYDRASLTPTAGTVYFMRLESCNGFNRDEDGIWQCDSDFRISYGD